MVEFFIKIFFLTSSFIVVMAKEYGTDYLFWGVFICIFFDLKYG